MDGSDESRNKEYWKANIRAVLVLLSIWFFVGYCLSIFLVEPLNRIQIGGFPLGFWFAQQGSIYVFIVLIFIYARWMTKIDKRFGLHEGEEQ